MLNPLGLLIPLLVLAAALPAGRALLGLLLRRPPDGLEGLVWSAALGLGLTGLAVMALGLAGLMVPWVLVATPVVLGAAGLALNRRRQTLARTEDMQPADPGLPGALQALLLGLVAVHLLYALLAALTPPMAPDAVSYHFSLPKQYLQQGAILPDPWEFRSWTPQNLEMLFTLGMGAADLGGGHGYVTSAGLAAAQGFSFLYHLLVLGALWCLARRWLGRSSAPLALLLYECFPQIHAMTPDMVEPALACMLTLALMGLLHWRDDGDRGWLLAAGLAAGLAGGIKLYGVVGAGLLAGCLVLLPSRRDPRSAGAAPSPAHGLRAAVLFGVLALVLASPWYVRAAAATGNPIYPYMQATLGGPPVARNAGAYFHQEMERRGELDAKPGLADRLVFPWYAVMGPRGSTVYPASPLLLAFAPLALLLALRRGALPPAAGLLALYTLGFTLLWTFQGAPKVRYLFGAFPAAAALAGLGLAGLRHAAPVAWRVGLVLALAVACFSAAYVGYARRGIITSAVRRQSAWDALSAADPYFRVCLDADRLLPPDAKVLCFRTAGTLYLPRPASLGNPFWQNELDYDEVPDAAALHAFLRARGFTHLLLRRWDGPPLPALRPAIRLVDELCARYAQELRLQDAEDVHLYLLETAR